MSVQALLLPRLSDTHTPFTLQPRMRIGAHWCAFYFIYLFFFFFFFFFSHSAVASQHTRLASYHFNLLMRIIEFAPFTLHPQCAAKRILCPPNRILEFVSSTQILEYGSLRSAIWLQSERYRSEAKRIMTAKVVSRWNKPVATSVFNGCRTFRRQDVS